MDEMWVIEMDAKGGTEDWTPLEFRHDEESARAECAQMVEDNAAYRDTDYRVRKWVRAGK